MDKRLQGGFSLVEILVGLVIGMLAMLAIFQTLALFESQRRTTGEGAQMQQNGLAALYMLEQDIRLGGFGLIDNGSMPCFNINAYGSPQSIFQSIPARIQDGGTGSDTLITARFDSDTGGIATGGGRAILANGVSALPAAITVDTGEGFKANDYILITQPSLSCSLLQVSGTYAYVPGGDPTSIPVQGVVNAAGTAAAPTFPNYTGSSVTPYATIVDLGPTDPFVTASFYVSNGSLVESDNGATAVPLASVIVNLQAQYGVAPAGSQSISCWTDATGSNCSPASGDWSNPTSADFARIKAIKIAVVARSDLKEKPSGGATACNTTTLAPISWSSVGLPAGSSAPPTIDLSSDPDWQCYRYKVYSTIIPLRNVIWGNL
ncbi:MAG: PilW family protein [Burkholderiales bacterium]